MSLSKVLLLGHSWVKHLVDEKEIAAEFGILLDWHWWPEPSINIITQNLANYVTNDHKYILVFSLLFDVWHYELLDIPHDQKLQVPPDYKVFMPNPKFVLSDFVTQFNKLRDHCHELNPNMKVIFICPPCIDAYAYNLSLVSKFSPEYQKIFHENPKYKDDIIASYARNIFSETTKLSQHFKDWPDKSFFRSHYTISKSKYHKSIINFMKGKINTLGENGPFIDGLNPSVQVICLFWEQLKPWLELPDGKSGLMSPLIAGNENLQPSSARCCDFSKMNMMITGDASVNFMKFGRKPGMPNASIYFIPYGDLDNVVKLTDAHLNSDIQVLLINCFTWEFLYVPQEVNRGMKSVLPLVREQVNYHRLVSQVEIETAKWKKKFPNLEVIWALPFPIDFYKHYSWLLKDSREEVEAHVQQSHWNGRLFYSMISQLIEAWNEYIPHINYINMKQCFFMGKSHVELNFQDEFADVELKYPEHCLEENGVTPSPLLCERIKNSLLKKLDELLTKESFHIPPSKEVPHVAAQRVNLPPPFEQPFLKADLKTPVKEPSNIFHEPPLPPAWPREQPFQTQTALGSTHPPLHGFPRPQYGDFSEMSTQAPSSPSPALNPKLGNPYDYYPSKVNQQWQTANYTESGDLVISGSLLANLKNALKFISDKTSDEDQPSSKPLAELNSLEIPESSYSCKLNYFFQQNRWKDLFLKGDSSVAKDAVLTSIKCLLKSRPGTGVNIIVITSNELFIEAMKEYLRPHIEMCSIGLNDETPKGSPIILLDLPTNLRLRISQLKYRDLSSLKAIIVYSDDLIHGFTSPGAIELSYLLKLIYQRVHPENLCKVVISESAREEYEDVSGQILHTKFSSTPSKRAKNDMSLFELLANEMEKEEMAKGKPKIVYDSRKKKYPTSKSEVETAVRPNKDNTKVTVCSEDRFRKSSKLKKDLSKLSSFDSTSRSTTDEGVSKSRKKEPPETTSKINWDQLEMTDMSAPTSVSGSKDDEINFAQFLQNLGPEIENAYLEMGRNLLLDHEKQFKNFIEVPVYHPHFKKKRDLFIENYRKKHGINYKTKMMETDWTKYWKNYMTCVKNEEWKSKQSKLQAKFLQKYSKQIVAFDTIDEEDIIVLSDDKLSPKPTGEGGAVGRKDDGEEDRDNSVVYVDDYERLAPFAEIKEPKKNIRFNVRPQNGNEATEIKSIDMYADSPKAVAVASEKREKPTNNSDQLDDALLETYAAIDEFMKAIGSGSLDAKVTSREIPMNELDSKASRCTKEGFHQFAAKKPKLSSDEMPHVSKMLVGLEDTLFLLESVCNVMGLMGPALKAIIAQARALLPDTDKALRIFAEDDSVTLVKFAIEKMQSLAVGAERVRYNKIIRLCEELLKGAESVPTPKAPPTALSVEEVARATYGKSAASVRKFIGRGFEGKGLPGPPQSEIDDIFRAVTKIHFEMSLKG